MVDDPKLDLRDLYERYGRAVYRRCQYFLRHDEIARDAMHDIFLKLAERGDQFRGEASPLTFLVRISTNHCLNILRARKAAWRERFKQTETLAHSLREGSSAAWERQELVRTLLAKVPRDVQEAAVYYFVDEMRQEDAAIAAGCSVPTLRKRLRRFIKVARQSYRDIDADIVFGEAPL